MAFGPIWIAGKSSEPNTPSPIIIRKRFNLLVLLLLVSISIIVSSGQLYRLDYFTRQTKSTGKTIKFPFEWKTPVQLANGNKSQEKRIQVINNLFVERYVKWHFNHRFAAERAAKAGERHSIRTLVFRADKSPTHGLGDRIRGMMHAYILAVLSNRVLLISWDKPIPLFTLFGHGLNTNFTYDEHIFGIHQKSIDNVVIEGKFFYEPLIKQHPAQNLYLDSVPSPIVNDLFQSSKLRRKHNKILQQLFEIGEVKPHELLPLIMKALFQPSTKMREVFAEGLDRLQMNPENLPITADGKIGSSSRFISLHARLGYGTDEILKDGGRFDLKKKGISMRTIANCFADRGLKIAKRKGMNQYPVFYLATDSPSFRTVLKEAFASRNKNAKLIFGDWDVRHVRDLKRDNVEDMKRYMYTIMDMFLLSKGEAMLHLRSGFADLAIWMGGMNDTSLLSYTICNKY